MGNKKPHESMSLLKTVVSRRWSNDTRGSYAASSTSGRSLNSSSLSSSSSGAAAAASSGRRGATRWSATVSELAGQLHSVRRDQREPRNLKSCLRVATLQESLDSARKNDDAAAASAAAAAAAAAAQRRACNNKQANKSIGGARRLSLLVGSRRSMLALATRDKNTTCSNANANANRAATVNDADNKDNCQTKEEEEEEEVTSKPKVGFAELHSRQYAIQAGYNPGVSRGGAAIELGWRYQDMDPRSLDEHEAHRSRQGPRKKLREMKLDRAERERRLLDSGVSRKEIQKSTKRINQARVQRRKTLEGMSEGRLRQQYKREVRVGRFKTWLGLEKTYDAREDELWDEANRKTMLLAN